MGLRFRKSVKAGPMRINFSKSGVGYSVGTKGFRYTKKANGGTRTTTSIPGTGISYVKDSRKTRPSSAGSPGNYASTDLPLNQPTAPMGNGNNHEDRKIVTGAEVALAWLLGWIGAHKFYRRKIGLGILYLLTAGLFLFGWIGDAICLSVQYSDQRMGRSTTWRRKIVAYIVSVACVLLLVSCGSRRDTAEFSVDSDATEIGTVVETTTEPSIESAAPEATVSETAVPETTVPETTVSKTTVPETTAPETTVPETTVPETAVPKTSELETTVSEATDVEQTPTYILNSGTMRFHTLRCSSVKDIAPNNYVEFFGSFSEAQDMGYTPCKRCLK